MKLANGFQSSVRFISLINETWEHRSFKELGIDALPTIHLGSEANALENKGIHTERGDYNRKVMELRGLAKFIDYTSVMIENYKKVAAKYSGYGNQIKSLLAKIEAYDRIKPFLDVVRKSESLKGLAKWRFDRANRSMLDEYPARLKEFRKVVPKGEKIDPQKWQKDMEALIDKREDMEGLLQKEVGDLACVEVIDFNKKNEEREHSNEVHAKERSMERERNPSRKSHQAER